jgi:hypothetical protein
MEGAFAVAVIVFMCGTAFFSGIDASEYAIKTDCENIGAVVIDGAVYECNLAKEIAP